VPWCIGGDFNVTLFFDERLRGDTHRSAVAGFVDFVCLWPEGNQLGPTICRGLDWIVFCFSGVGILLHRSYAEKASPGVLGSCTHLSC
jgi:hypothetical protein